MEKTFYFQPHLRYCAAPLRWFFAVCIAGTLAIPAVAGVPFNIHQPLLRMALFSSMTFVCLSMLAQIVCPRWRNARFVVTDDRLIHYDLFSVKVMSFANVRSLWHVHFLYWLGVAVLRSDSGTMYLPFVVDDISGLAGAVAERLAAHGKGDLCHTKRFAGFLRAARINDIINEQIYRDIGRLSRVVLSAAAFSAYVAIYAWGFHVSIAMLWALCGAVVPMCTYLAANLRIAMGVAEFVDTSSHGQPRIEPHAMYARLGLVAGFVYLAAGIAFRWFWKMYINV